MDKLLHASVCFLAAFIAGLIGLWLNIGLSALFIYASLAWILPALTKEYADKAHGDIWDWSDIIADCFGGIIGTTWVILINVL